MVASRSGPKGAELASFGLAGLIFLLTPSQGGHQDLGALLAQQPAVAARWREHLISSPFGTIHAATFSLPRPLGTMPEPSRFRLASLDPNDPDVVGSIAAMPMPGTHAPAPTGIVFPAVNRTGKGDKLVPGLEQRQPEPAAVPAAPPEAPPEELPDVQGAIESAILLDARPPEAPRPQDELEAALRVEPFPEYDISLSLELHPAIPSEEPGEVADIDPAELYPAAPPSLDGLNAEMKAARLYFNRDPVGRALGAIEPWRSGEEPVLMAPRVADPEIKRAALTPPPPEPKPGPGVTIAGKGEVTGEGKRPMSPAERLKLTVKARAKAEKCLSNAVYFEARSEPVRGQIAVAQVVMNRVFSGFYPSDVCGTVYQNSHRHLACQFTFSCDGIPDVVTDTESWERAKRIAKETLDGKLWLPEIAKATHYHASYVSPWWVRSMKRHAKIGLHNFYRPRKWGDRAEAPSWGSAGYTADVANKL